MIPPRTAEKMRGKFMPGERHNAMIQIAMSLIGNGMNSAAVFAQLRSQFPDADKSDKEIEDVISWVQGRNPQPSGRIQMPYERSAPVKSNPKKAVSDITAGEKADMKSPVVIEADQTSQLFVALYHADEFINVVCQFTTIGTNGDTKANPQGAGANKRRDDWLEYFKAKGTPSGEAGAWMRPNPVRQKGSGADGAITDADITARRFLLLESDVLAPDEQLAFYQKLDIPIAAILSSGGKSYHAWLRMDCETAGEYRDRAKRILEILQPFGVDQANKNASRLSRLPGAIRKIGASGDGCQRLIYLNPKAAGITDDEIQSLILRLKPRKFKAKPMREAVLDALEHYQDIHDNKSKTGLRTGFPYFDSLTGGLKNKWLIVVAGQTNSGKSSYVLNIILNVLKAGRGVALFSFEMDHQEILDICFAREAEVSRNKFNTGWFKTSELLDLSKAGADVGAFKLHVFDDPTMSATDVFESAERLALDGNLALAVVDYIQLANVDAYKDSREQQIAHVSRQLKAMAKRLEIPVIGVSQLNEEGRVRESRAIAHDANCVMCLEQGDDEKITVQIVKGRSIPKGNFYYTFEKQFCRFTETGCDENLTKLLPKEHNDYHQ